MRCPETELQDLKKQGLLRSLNTFQSHPLPSLLTANGRTLLNFSSNDYLGLSQHHKLKDAAITATQANGTGATASRLVCGTFDYHRKLEEDIARLKQTDDAHVFANGYATALGTITALLGKGDTIILDKLSHACLIDAAKLCGATIRVFPHNDLGRLEDILKSVRAKADETTRILVSTESVFSMDGDTCPLADIIALKNQYEALLLLDEAHALGVIGPQGLGLAEELGLQGEVDLQMGTLGKACGAAGGYLAASQTFIDLLTNKARSFIYSTAPPPAQMAAALAGLNLIVSEEGQKLREKLQSNHSTLRSLLKSSCYELSDSEFAIPIVPLIFGENQRALAAARLLLKDGLLVPAIRYPTVPKGTARLRVTLSASHEEAHLERLASALLSVQ